MGFSLRQWEFQDLLCLRGQEPTTCFGVCHFMLEPFGMCIQGSYGSWKTSKVLEFYCGIFQDWKDLEKDYWSWKILEIC